MTESDELDALFDQFETPGELLGFTFREKGERVFRQFLDLEPTNLTKPFCLKVADELAGVGMGRAAELLRERAETVPVDDRYCCPYDDPNNVHGAHWLKGQKARYGDEFDESRVNYGSSSLRMPPDLSF